MSRKRRVVSCYLLGEVTAGWYLGAGDMHLEMGGMHHRTERQAGCHVRGGNLMTGRWNS